MFNKIEQKVLLLGLLLSQMFTSIGLASTAPTGKYFDRVVFVLFENANYSDAIKQPFFSELAKTGIHFTNFLAEVHPSQGNYIALTSGDLNGVTSDNTFDVNAKNIVDLLESKGLSWKVYAEDYPGNCFTGATSKDYARKHNPFISYVNIQTDKVRCAKIVNASEFDTDVKNGTLPNYSFYIPNNKNDGHDTNAKFADGWYSGKFGPLVKDANFMNGLLLISTFDESGFLATKNQIYTSFVGSNVQTLQLATSLNHYSLLRLVEDNWSLGNLGKNDVQATPIPNETWK